MTERQKAIWAQVKKEVAKLDGKTAEQEKPKTRNEKIIAALRAKGKAQ